MEILIKIVVIVAAIAIIVISVNGIHDEIYRDEE